MIFEAGKCYEIVTHDEKVVKFEFVATTPPSAKIKGTNKSVPLEGLIRPKYISCKEINC